MSDQESPIYRLFSELFRTHTPEEVGEWGQQHWPGLPEVLRAMSGERASWEETAMSAVSGVASGWQIAGPASRRTSVTVSEQAHRAGTRSRSAMAA